ncbi:MAG TPA: trypsin-like peptidase domain-containing protein [Kofleriaceae bacterium]|nr:trypsin-like peptidase domain-containing protein [Kofleriaceae bacterium]
MRFVMRLACAIGFGLVMGTRLVVAAPASPQQEIAMIAKPSVVRVWGAYIATYEVLGSKIQKAIGGSGTGFFITGDGYIATNAHVVTSIHDGDDKAKEDLLRLLLQDIDKQSGGQLTRMPKAQLAQVVDSIRMTELQKRAYVVLPNGDHLDYEIKEIGKAGTGRDCALIKVKTSNAPTLPIGDSTRSQVEDHIVVIGYPGVADSEWLLDEKSQLQASVTDGAISSLKRASSGEQILQISAPITHGNSGGPAIDQRGNVIGLATFGNDGQVQGFNFLVASATLLELVKDAKIDPRPSPTSEAWRAGLVHYWADEYTEAISKFEDVETLYPAHSEAANLIRLSHQAQKDGKEKPPPSNTGLIAGLVIGGVVLIGVVILVVILIVRRGRTRAPVPAGPPPVYGAPPAYGAPPPGQPQLPMYGRIPPQAMPQQAQQAMYGRVASPSAGTPIAKTVAIGGGIAPTAFGSLSVGSITCTRGPLIGERFALTATGIIVGRQPGVAHVLVNDHRASGKHVWIGMENGVLVAIDQNTTNGTYINDVARGRITRSALRDGDVIIIGEPDCLSLQVKLG